MPLTRLDLSLFFFACRVFVINQIPDSNLLLVVIQADCDCSRQYVPITMEPKEVKYILKTPAKSGSPDHTLRRWITALNYDQFSHLKVQPVNLPH